MTAVPKRSITAEEYLAAERRAEVRHEYYRGEVFAMSGASREHNLLAHHMARALSIRLDGRPCEVYQSDMRVLVEATGLYTYPGVVVVCGEPRFLDGAEVDTLLNPTVVIEVLSESTASYDRGPKFRHYQRVESLRDYVLVAQGEMAVERFARREEGWLAAELLTAPADVLELGSIQCAIPLAEIYAKVAFPPPKPDDPRARPGHPR